MVGLALQLWEVDDARRQAIFFSFFPRERQTKVPAKANKKNCSAKAKTMREIKPAFPLLFLFHFLVSESGRKQGPIKETL